MQCSTLEIRGVRFWQQDWEFCCAGAGMCCGLRVCAPVYSSCSADLVGVTSQFTGSRGDIGVKMSYRLHQ